ncbi:uncharacterized protein LOC132389797 [Hypanus sabinus]|uniref:uncharacterized protein LOC132389797 n=1 Tax=Hypanus sabinus TaxID=79690 RepID=UPI0028C4C718|nr:uncharacterized protein LOC132389797 [Hypanus sabinus]
MELELILDELSVIREDSNVASGFLYKMSSGKYACTLHPALVGTGLTHLLTQASSDNGCFPDLSSETQRILGRMDRSESHMKVKLGKTDSRSPSRAEPDVSYAEQNFKSRSAPRFRIDREDPNFTYSDLKFRNEEPRIDQHEYPPIASGPGGLSTTTQTAAQEQESKVKIRNRRYRLTCLLCLITSALMVVVVGLSIHGEWNGLRVEYDHK